jgi:predicted transposase YbfD/YdcC
LLDAVESLLGSLAGVLFVADALHTQTGHAEQITRRGAHLLLQAKGNQPTLHAQLKAVPWAQIPVGDRTRDRGHGRKETRTVKAVTLQTPGGIAFPHARQAVRITRTRTVEGKTSRETAYLITSLTAADAQPADLQKWVRSEWLIENQIHTSEMSRSVRIFIRPGPAPGPPSWRHCVTPRSAGTASTAKPPSPVPTDAPTAVQTTSSRP